MKNSNENTDKIVQISTISTKVMTGIKDENGNVKYVPVVGLALTSSGEVKPVYLTNDGEVGFANRCAFA